MSSILGMPVGSFLLVVGIALVALVAYRPTQSDGTKMPIGTLVSAFLVCVLVGVIAWPWLGPALSHFTMTFYGVK
jgi:hypothetical protein